MIHLETIPGHLAETAGRPAHDSEDVGGAIEGSSGTYPRRICLVTETFPPEVNGVALTLARLAGGLAERGHEVSIVRPRQPRHDPRRGDGDRGVVLVPGFALPGYPEVRVGLPSAGALAERWSALRPDVVYVATEGPLGWSAVRAAGALGVPALSGFHTSFAEYAGHYGLRWLSPVVLGYLRRLHNRTRGTLVATAELRRRLTSLGFRDVAVLGRGVDGARFHPGRRSRRLRGAWGAKDGDVVALHVGRLAPEKNVPLAIEALRAMQRARPGTRGVIVGDGPMRAALERAHPDLVFCGMRTGEDLAAHYASADAFLFPSETETFGNVTLEAMASGLAVAAYDYAAARVHVAHGESGVLAPRGDRRAFVERAAGLVLDGGRLAEMGRAARAHAATVTWPGVVAAFERHLIDASLGAGAGAWREGSRAAGAGRA